MQVVCNQCHVVCEVDADDFAAPGAALKCDACSAALSLPDIEIRPETTWLVLMPQGQAGPYGAARMAELLDHARIDWGSLVWRSGLKGWRPGRRDPLLVTSVASARGAGGSGDTQRVSVSPRSFLPVTDTIVEPLKRVLGGRASDSFAVAMSDPVADNSDEFTKVTQRGVPALPGRGGANRSAPPIASAPPQAARDGDAYRSAPPIASVPSRTTREGDAHRSAPPIVSPPPREADDLDSKDPDTQPVFQPAYARASAPNSWLPSLQSMSLVAIVAFAFGVLAAALWGRFVARHEQRAATMVVRPARVPAPFAEAIAEPVPEAAPVTSPPAAQFQPEAPVTPALSELPIDAELRREVRRISPDVRRCIDDLSLGAEIEAYFEGLDGRVSELRVRTPGLSPGHIECVTQIARQMQVTPFQSPRYKFWYRFSY